MVILIELMIDEPLLKYIKERFNTTSMLDIGCGSGGMKEVVNNMDIDWYGVDGDVTVIENRLFFST